MHAYACVHACVHVCVHAYTCVTCDVSSAILCACVPREWLPAHVLPHNHINLAYCLDSGKKEVTVKAAHVMICAGLCDLPRSTCVAVTSRKEHSSTLSGLEYFIIIEITPDFLCPTCTVNFRATVFS